MALSKPNEEASIYFDIVSEKPRKLYRIQKENKTSRKSFSLPKSFNLSEMVTLQIIKSSHETGVVKKMLHAPTLKLFAVKVDTLNDKITIKFLGSASNYTRKQK